MVLQVAAVGLIGIALAFLYPRAPTWQVPAKLADYSLSLSHSKHRPLIPFCSMRRRLTLQIVSMQYESISMNYDLTANVQIRMDLEIYNPNFVPAHVNNITLVMLHEDVYGRDVAFGVIRVQGEFNLRMRSSRVVDSCMALDAVPPTVALQLGREIAAKNGTVLTKARSYMDVTIFRQKLMLEAECVQELQADVFPVRIKRIECSYFYNDALIPVLPP
ncbi:unnamed protein product [Phaeothamnion confervicola]